MFCACPGNRYTSFFRGLVQYFIPMMIFNSGRKTATAFLSLILFPLICFAQISGNDINKADPTCFTPQQLEDNENIETESSFSIEPPLADFIDQYSSKYHVDKNQVSCLFKKISLNHTAIRLMKPSTSGKTRNWQTYRARMIEPVRVAAGVRFWNTYEKYLDKAEKKYGVPAYIIVGILGIETIYGRDTGRFRTLDALTTLAFYYPDAPNRASRQEFFRKELEQFLLLATQNKIDPLSIYGSYAGAIGWPQFMPGSVRAYAVDFDGDGKIDLENSPIDAIGSVANFLKQHGWKTGHPVIFPAEADMDCPLPITLFNQGLKATYSLKELDNQCISTELNTPNDYVYGLIDLQNGKSSTEYRIGTDNFFAITQYNRSYFYAMSVIELGKKVFLEKTASYTY